LLGFAARKTPKRRRTLPNKTSGFYWGFAMPMSSTDYLVICARHGLATVRRRRERMSGMRLDGSSHIIAQFGGPVQGGLDADEFQFAGGDLSCWFVVSFGCA
jgi:hypothetical protein